MLVPIRMGTNMASPYKSLLMLWKHFFGYLVYEIFLLPESWWGSLHIYLLSFPRFWTWSIKRFWFLATSNQPAIVKLMEDWRIIKPKGLLAIGCGSLPWCDVGTTSPPELKHFVYNSNNDNNTSLFIFIQQPILVLERHLSLITIKYIFLIFTY